MVAERDHSLEQAKALARKALDAWRGADPDHALDACDHALALLLPVGPSDALADVLRWKGSVLRDRGNHAAASHLYTQSLTVADKAAYRGGRAHALNCIGTVAQFRGDLGSAERSYGEAARLAHRIGDRKLSGMVQQNLGIVADMQGRTDEALAHFRLALASFEAEEQRDAALLVLNNLGVLYTREGSFARAGDVLARALSLALALKDVVSETVVEENRAKLFLATGNIEKAEAAATRAFALAERRRDNTRRAAALRLLALIGRQGGKDHGGTQAMTLLERALALCQLGDDVMLRIEILADLGDACADCGESARARDTWHRALELARLAGLTGMVETLRPRFLRRRQGKGLQGPSEAGTIS